MSDNKNMFLAKFGHSGHLDDAVKSSSSVIRQTAASNPLLNDKQASHLIKDEDSDPDKTSAGILRDVASNKNVSSKVITPLLNHPKQDVANAALENPNSDKKEAMNSIHVSVRSRSLRDHGTKEDVDKGVTDKSPYVRSYALMNKHATKSHLDKVASQHKGEDEDEIVNDTIVHKSMDLGHYPKIANGHKITTERVSHADISKLKEPQYKKAAAHFNIKTPFYDRDAVDVLSSAPSHINHVAQQNEGAFGRLHVGHTMLMSSPHLNTKSLETLGVKAGKDSGQDHIAAMALQHKNITKEAGQKIIDANPDNKFLHQLKSIHAKIK